MTIWRKPIVAVLTSTLVLAHGEPFFALGRAGGNATEKSSVAAAQREESPGYVRNPTALRATPATVRLPAIDFERARRTLTAQREVIQRMLKEPRIAGNRDDLLRRQVARIDKALLYVDISRSHGAVRHELIRRLPVTISETAAAGERAGTYRDYSVGGKVRVRVFLPESVPTVTADRDLEQPDDMSPFEQPDGESPAEYAREDCFYEDDDGPFSGPCVTQQDIDDAAIVEADLLANEDAMVADADSA